MSKEPLTMATEAETRPNALLIHSLLRFLHSVRYRKHIVITCLVVACLLGGLHYMTAQRKYVGTASILVMQTGIDRMSTPTAGDMSLQRNTMETFERVVRSPRVMEAALKKLPREDRIDLVDVPPERWVRALQASVSSQALRSTNILEISYTSADPQVAVNVVNAIADAFREFLDEIHAGAASDIYDVLVKQRDEMKDELGVKQSQLRQSKLDFGDIGLEGEGRAISPVVQRFIYFSNQLDAVDAELLALQTAIPAIEDAIQNGGDASILVSGLSDALGAELVRGSLGRRNDILRMDLERRLGIAEADLEAVRPGYGSAHPEFIARTEAVLVAERALREYEARFTPEGSRLENSELGSQMLEMVRRKLAETYQRRESLAGQCEICRAQAITQADGASQIAMLAHDVERLGTQSEALLDQIATMGLKQDDQDIRGIRIDTPEVSETPVSPRLRSVALMSLLAGLVCGLGIVYVLDILDDRFRSVEDMEQQLGTSVLTMVRQLAYSESDGLESLQMYAEPMAAESEAFRTLRTALALKDQELRQVVVSSAEPGDGKTTVLANLAVCYAQSQKKTLLIDADLRRPRLTSSMGMRSQPGLSGLIGSSGEVEKLAAGHVVPSGMDDLDFLPSGPRPGNPAELLTNPRFAQLLAWAETVYDRILIDSPPALAASDTAVIGRLVDGVILVVQPDKNRRRLVLRTVDGLTSLGCRLLGVVVNRMTADTQNGYYSYGYGYGYGHDDENDGFDGQDTRQMDEEDSDGSVVPRRVA